MSIKILTKAKEETKQNKTLHFLLEYQAATHFIVIIFEIMVTIKRPII